MARYYFDVEDGGGLHRDEIGDEFTSFEEARDQCQALLPDIAREELPAGDLLVIRCQVRDEAGQVIYRGELTFRGARFWPDGPEAPSWLL